MKWQPTNMSKELCLFRYKACQAMSKCEALESQGKYCPPEILAAAEEKARILRGEFHKLTGILLVWHRMP